MTNTIFFYLLMISNNVILWCNASLAREYK